MCKLSDPCVTHYMKSLFSYAVVTDDIKLVPDMSGHTLFTKQVSVCLHYI
jgi:hypothetical protein